jgi:hypothetical protein
MPYVDISGDGGEGVGHGRRDGEWIKVARTTAPENHDPYPEILHIKTPRVKLNRKMLSVVN